MDWIKLQHDCLYVYFYFVDTSFEVKLDASVLASVRAKREKLDLSGKRVVSDKEWEKVQKEVRNQPTLCQFYNSLAILKQFY